MRFILAMFAAGLLLIWMGGRKIYEAAACGKQQTVAYTQFVKKHPGMGWFKVTGAAWDIEDCMYVTKKSKYGNQQSVKKVFLPLYAANAAPGPNSKIVAVLETDRKDMKDFVERAANTDNNSMPTPPAHLVHFAGNVEGTVAFGGDIDSEGRSLLQSKLSGVLAPNYVVIRDGEKPNAGMGFLCLVGGIALTGLGGAMFFNRDRD